MEPWPGCSLILVVTKIYSFESDRKRTWASYTHFALGFGASFHEHSYIIWSYPLSRTRFLLAGVDVHGNTGTWRKGSLLRKRTVRITYYFVAGYSSCSLPACFLRDTPTRSVLQYFGSRVDDEGWMADSTQQ